MVPLENTKILRISWTTKKSKETVLQEADTTRSSINRIHKCQVTCFDHVMKREELEHFGTAAMIDARRNMQQGEIA